MCEIVCVCVRVFARPNNSSPPPPQLGVQEQPNVIGVYVCRLRECVYLRACVHKEVETSRKSSNFETLFATLAETSSVSNGGTNHRLDTVPTPSLSHPRGWCREGPPW